MIIEDLKEYEEKFDKLDLASIQSFNKKSHLNQKSLSGEEDVFRILRTYTDKIIRNVVLLNAKRTNAFAVDFVVELNGFLLLINAKSWKGTMYTTDKREKVLLVTPTVEGDEIRTLRTNPLVKMAYFTSDFLDYLKPNCPKKNLQLKRVVVFTDDIDLEPFLSSYDTTIQALTLETLKKYLYKLSVAENNNPYSLSKELPSWDYYYNSSIDSWFRIAIITKTITTSNGEIELKDIDSMLMSDSDDKESIIKFRNGTYLSTMIDKKSVKTNDYIGYTKSSLFRYIKLNKELHNC